VVPCLNPVSIAMRISARNQIRGTVIEVKKGATTSHVRVA
jgi:molybdopterin-binding protein